jgi:uncharacterized repeat protein (TIGR01451 family)
MAACLVAVFVVVGGIGGAHSSGSAAAQDPVPAVDTPIEPGPPREDPLAEVPVDAGVEPTAAGEDVPIDEAPTPEDQPDPSLDPGGFDTSRATPANLILLPSPPGQVDRDAPFTRSFTVRNRGGQTATGVEVTVRLPVGVRIVGVLPEMDGGTCTVASVADDPSLIAVCTRRSLAPDAQVSMVLTLEATATARCGPLVVTATARASNEPPAKVGADNRGRVPDRLVCAPEAGPDLSVAVTSDAGTIELPRARFAYHVTVRNEGDAAARGVSIDHALPRGLRVIGLPTVAGGVCTVASSIDSGGAERWSIACRIDQLAAGATVALTTSVQVLADPRCGPAATVVEVAARNEPEGNVGNENRARFRVTLACPPTLEVAIDSPDSAHAAQAVGVRIVVRNAGGTQLRNVRAAQTPCGPVVFDRLDPGQVRMVGCQWSIKAADGDPVRLAVRFSGRDLLGQRAVGRAATSIDVLHPAIGLAVRTEPSSGTPGQLVTYRYVVRNLGDTPLSGVVIRDPAVGRVEAASTLAPGTTRLVSVSVRLPSSTGAVGRTVEVRGSDRLGREVTADASVSVTVVRAGTSPTGGATAFTGADAGRMASIVIALTIVGLLALTATRVRARPTADAD